MTKLISNLQACKLNALSDRLVTSFQNGSETHKEYIQRLYIQCDESRKQALIDGIFSIIQKEQLECTAIGGLSVKLDRGWWHLRASVKHSAIVARCGGQDHKSYLDVIEHLRCKLLSFGLKLQTHQDHLWR